ncbi:MAG: hypothetical protein JWQ34_2106 [Mucilaginibacter sp.]|uniref:hypothetical protein n=1 Tax=Mucilaginibacter sp. TaxID=1882438 RepID=UPI00262901C1|nr:hypothetical protein [Mucilaginibacter sp.]MDB5003881.1 hypothetical protein [Mucilaginibacter sp.]
MEQQPILCPICKSQSLSANRETFNQKRAVIGNLAFGTQGLLYGHTGSKNVIITCLSCGYEFKPGEGATEDDFEEKNSVANQKIADIETSKQNKRLVAFLVLIAMIFVIIWLFSLIN